MGKGKIFKSFSMQDIKYLSSMFFSRLVQHIPHVWIAQPVQAVIVALCFVTEKILAPL